MKKQSHADRMAQPAPLQAIEFVVDNLNKTLRLQQIRKEQPAL
jgi:hypothetical protein